ncbi:MAG: cysteine desulfurase [Candidatus Diapherotrites archaeon]
MKNINELRKDFPALFMKFNGKHVIYLDNAATSLKPLQVIEAEKNYYEQCCANIHRGMHKMSEHASRLYEEAHKKTAKFINAKSEQEIIFTRNATESFNLLMYSLWAGEYFKKGDKILVSKMEHHANLVPWQFLEKKIGIELEFVELNENFLLDFDDLKEKINEKTKVVSLTHSSNTVSGIVDIKKAGKIIRQESDALFTVDAAQSVPHMPVNVKELDCDFLCFSGHKMCGPTGIGVLFGKKNLLEKMNPFMYGGDMVKEVKFHESIWNNLPYKFEAGTPAIAQGIALGAAVDYLQKIGMQNIRKHELELISYGLERISELEEITVFGPSLKHLNERNGIILFESNKLHCHEIALALDEHSNIAVRSGMHCAQPFVSSLNKEGLARASFYLYNTKEEIDGFIKALKEIMKNFS